MSSRPETVASAVVLCAGASSRMGRNKGLLPLGDRALLAHHVERLGTVALRVVVVLGPEPERHRAVLPPEVDVVVNEAWARSWPADSLRLAARTLAHGSCLVTPVDVPPARPDTLRALVAAGAPALPVGPDGVPGHPVLLDAALVDLVARQAPEGGLRTLLGAARRVPVSDPDVALDFDEPEDWARWLARREEGGGG